MQETSTDNNFGFKFPARSFFSLSRIPLLCVIKYRFLLIQVDDLSDSPSSSECSAPNDFHATPPDVFGSPAYFQFCLDVPLSSPEFPIARWNGPIKDQVRKVSQLIRKGIPIVWQNGIIIVGKLNCRKPKSHFSISR